MNGIASVSIHPKIIDEVPGIDDVNHNNDDGENELEEGIGNPLPNEDNDNNDNNNYSGAVNEDDEKQEFRHEEVAAETGEINPNATINGSSSKKTSGVNRLNYGMEFETLKFENRRQASEISKLNAKIKQLTNRNKSLESRNIEANNTISKLEKQIEVMSKHYQMERKKLRNENKQLHDEIHGKKEQQYTGRDEDGLRDLQEMYRQLHRSNIHPIKRQHFNQSSLIIKNMNSVNNSNSNSNSKPNNNYNYDYNNNNSNNHHKEKRHKPNGCHGYDKRFSSVNGVDGNLVDAMDNDGIGGGGSSSSSSNGSGNGISSGQNDDFVYDFDYDYDEPGSPMYGQHKIENETIRYGHMRHGYEKSTSKSKSKLKIKSKFEFPIDKNDNLENQIEGN